MNPFDSGDLPSVELTRLSVRGNDDAWARLSAKLIAAAESVAQKIADSASDPGESDPQPGVVANDMAALAASWAQAKIQRPTLENELIRAEIAVKYAEATRAAAEADKLREEARNLRETRQAERVSSALENLERVMRLAATQGGLAVGRVNGDLHILAGCSPSELELEPSQDVLREVVGDEPPQV